MRIYRLKEAKTSQLRKLLNNGNITEEQFNIADEFFKKHTAFEREIDWNRGLKITWDDLESVIYKERSSESQTKKKIRKGLEGFEEGKDYVVLEETKDYVAYQPFTWESSRMIASHYVEPSKSRYGNVEDAGWCTAYQKTRTYWDAHNEKEAFIYICGETIPSKKVAISISEEDEDANGVSFLYFTEGLNFNIWDFEDSNDTIWEEELLRVVPNLYNLIKEAYNNWKNRNKKDFLSKLKLNPQTNRYDYDGDLTSRQLKNFIAKDGDGFTINFGEVIGNFECSWSQLTSLKGAPEVVVGNFDCSANYLTSLEGAPKEINGAFICVNNKLTSLVGSPQKVSEDFNCSSNQLTSLEGAPLGIRGSFYCSWNKLTSLKGAPQIIGGYFNCSSNELTSLEGAPQKCLEGFNCSENKLTSLKEAPKEVGIQGFGGNFNCIDNQLTSLEGAPKKCFGSFYCSENKLTSLEGAPQEITKSFSCSENELTSLKGAPQIVGGGFYCYSNKLTSLEGAPEYVGMDFDCSNNPNLHSLDGIGEVKGYIYVDF